MAQPTVSARIPIEVGQVMNRTLEWLKTAGDREVLYFYERMDSYPIAAAQANYGSLIRAVTNRAAQLGMDIRVSRSQDSPDPNQPVKGYYLGSAIHPEDPGPDDPTTDIYVEAVDLAERMLAGYAGEETDLAVLEVDHQSVTLKELLDMAWVFMQFAEEVARP